MAKGKAGLGIVPLERHHNTTIFDCGVASLNEYLHKFAWQNQNRYNSARTFIALSGNRVAGYYTLAYGSVDRSETTARVSRGVGKHRVPVIVLGRLAVDRAYQGQRLGVGLLKDAVLRAAAAAEHAGLRAMLVHAIDEGAKSFYTQFDFIPSPHDPLTLFLTIEDIHATVGEMMQE